VLACHPDDQDWFAHGTVLSGLTRVDSVRAGTGRRQPDPRRDRPAPRRRRPARHPRHRLGDRDASRIAHRMLDAADLWVFVTTAARYADAPSWQLLKARQGNAGRAWFIVLSRVPAKSRDVILKHFVRMLEDSAWADVERFVIQETGVTGGRLPDEEIRELRMWLAELSVDSPPTGTGRTDDAGRRARQLQEQGPRAGTAARGAGGLPRRAAHRRRRGLHGRARRDRRGDAQRLAAARRCWPAGRTSAGSGDLRLALHLRRSGRFAGKAQQQAPARLRALKSALRTGMESIITLGGAAGGRGGRRPVAAPRGSGEPPRRHHRPGAALRGARQARQPRDRRLAGPHRRAHTNRRRDQAVRSPGSCRSMWSPCR